MMLRVCLFLVLKRKITHCTDYRSRLFCLEYLLHIFLPLHHWVHYNDERGEGGGVRGRLADGLGKPVLGKQYFCKTWNLLRFNYYIF